MKARDTVLGGYLATALSTDEWELLLDIELDEARIEATTQERTRIRAAIGPLREYDGDCLPVMEGMTRVLAALTDTTGGET